MNLFVERYKHLPYAWAKLKFLDLQLELLDDYRIRLLQVKNQETNSPLSQVYTAILNTVNCIVDALQGWADMVVRQIPPNAFKMFKPSCVIK